MTVTAISTMEVKAAALVKGAALLRIMTIPVGVVGMAILTAKLILLPQ